MVPTTRGQKEVPSLESAILHYQGALWTDCRISAFYPGQKTPDLVFVDLDGKDFCSMRALKTALTKILKRIDQKIGGCPTILWSGRGYHLIQPISCNTDLDGVKQYADVVKDKDVNKAFLQFASYYLSGGRKDPNNRTSLKSCLLRVPHSFNSKCKAEGKDPEVKIIQEWNGYRPDVKLMLGSFYSNLVAEKEIEDQRLKELAARFVVGSTTKNGSVTQWIERLIQTPLGDYRKFACNLIIIPYLVVRKGMTDSDEIEVIVMQWADRCDEIEPLRPSYREFEKAARYRIGHALRNMIPPMSFDKVQQENPELAENLMRETWK